MLKTVLCADIGTTSLKAGLFTADGEAVFLCRKSFKNPDDRFLASSWLDVFASACQKLSGEEKSSISGICISGAGPSLVLENGLTFRWNEILSENHNLPASAEASLFLPRILELKKRFPKEYDESSLVFSGPEFLIYQLSGKALTILPEKRYEKAYWNDDSARSCGIELEKLPPFYAPSSFAGKLTHLAAEKLGLAEEIPLFCGAPDFVAALIGTNTLKAGRLCDRAGSSEGFNYCSDRLFFTEATRSLPSVIPGLWNVSALSSESGRIFVEYKHRLEKERGSAIEYQKLVEDAVNNSSGQGGTIIRQILNQVKNSVGTLKKALKSQGMEFPSSMTVTGGQAKNDLWMQLKADTLKMTLEICNCADSELTGDACVAWTGLGLYKSIEEAADKIVKVTKRFIPKNENL